MTDFRQLQDHRFQGRDNAGLMTLLTEFTQSNAAERFSRASQALRELAAGLEQVDETLRAQLRELKIDWTGAAGDNAGEKVTVTADVATSGTEAGQQNSKATAVQGDNYSDSRNGMPDASKLGGDTETDFWDDAGGFFGYETDHAKEVKETQAAREQVIRGFDQYVDASRDSLNQYQGMNKPPTFDVTTASSATATPVAAVQQPGGGISQVPGGGVGQLPGNPPPQVPGGGSVNPPPQLPGGSTGILPPTTTPPPGAAPLLPGKVGGGPSGLGLGLGLGLTAGTALTGLALTAKGGKVVRGPSAPGTPGGGKGDGPHGKGEGPHGAKGSGVKGAVPGASGLAGKAGISATIGAIDPDGERVPGSRGTAGAGKAGAGSMMQAAASPRGKDGEEDAEHIRKYGVDSDDVFGDERMVVQQVIGDEPETK
ncbi:hypothetical protein [Saccharothrix variisporea]|uniref:PPE family protein n=1 Tax=Saccharothrix variisporea TaxID=543527 RepID=A0A495XCN7_9PSEU|nr:hypothetical protein [Saccharothrix variisporea]RKT71757.1 hypothetical protein DFJ66_5052 [Saccharothrix variisporea]